MQKNYLFVWIKALRTKKVFAFYLSPITFLMCFELKVLKISLL